MGRKRVPTLFDLLPVSPHTHTYQRRAGVAQVKGDRPLRQFRDGLARGVLETTSMAKHCMLSGLPQATPAQRAHRLHGTRTRGFRPRPRPCRGLPYQWAWERCTENDEVIPAVPCRDNRDTGFYYPTSPNQPGCSSTTGDVFWTWA